MHIPSWNERYGTDYYNSICKMKLISEIFDCNYNNHTIFYQPSWKRLGKNPTLNKTSKLHYGYNCALFKCFLMAFYEKSLPLYEDDEQFKNILPT